VGQTIAEMIRNAGSENLRLVLKPPESPRVYDTVAIALERIAVRMLGLRVAAPAGSLDGKPQMLQHSKSGYFCGSSLIAVIATVLVSPASLATVERSLRASSVRVGAIAFA
jgi:hypothetical protein